MERLNRSNGNTWADGCDDRACQTGMASRQDPQNGSGVTNPLESQVECVVENGSRGDNGRDRRRAPPSARPNPIERYIACFVTVRAAADAAGVSTAMLRRMRARGYVSTRQRALRMARACGFRLQAAELLALHLGAP
ncbi:hypothetical protein [Lysobacter enzymogenes]|uniref:hypothetical protein n=1 Tax=Lysobacter enzymogenes TaxID=69 RepID=UPI001A9703AF|nr:hypothetical protein [Lysobacter enzymogenes]QQP96928.1 hypothetical protein JHW38_02415 [Lysobacter enzymogenes]